ncbi:prolyl endopeptidase isoform X2 [Eurosta solidaginis]|uniref:prolyl endopeptidase isoform X2 n=1 Tax=Eurosta solidaginis TaxID=178769 RepID=UPI0035313CC7
MNYPLVRKDSKCMDDYHGVTVVDEYRWMEDPNSEETQAFIRAQNDISKPFIEEGGVRLYIESKLTKIWNYPKYSCPSRHGECYYFYANSGLQNHNVLYQQKSLSDDPQIFFDPNLWSQDGTIALAQISFSEDGNYMAYGLSENGSDWIKIKIRYVNSCKDFSDCLENVKFSEISWTSDSKGFFYSQYCGQVNVMNESVIKRMENQKLYYHFVGKTQIEDILIAEFPEEPSWRIQAVVSDCGRYVIMCIVKGCRDNLLFYIDLSQAENIRAGLMITKLINEFECDYEEKENVLDWAKCVDESKLLICYIEDVKSSLQVNCLITGTLIRKFNLDVGTVVTASGKKKHSEFFFSFTSFLNPGTIYQYDFKTPEEPPKIFREVKLNIDGYSQTDYEVKQLFYKSKDGTKVPMFIIHKRKESIFSKPCLLYGYGGFNISMQPTFSVAGLMFIDIFDGMLAYPNIRGGGEYGEKWHNGGRLLNKQNVFDDFQAAAEFLIANKYTAKDQLVIQGGSNGGLLVGACINQRPDLFAAAVAQVGVMDMLRFHQFTIGQAWCSDYGNPSEREHFENLFKYSPLHNVHTPRKKSEEYPSTLILTADHDDRVSPLHSLKFAAALQEAVRYSSFQKNPILLRVYNKSGHGAGKPTSKKIEETADILTFIYKAINVNTLNK